MQTKLPGSIGPTVEAILPASKAMMGRNGDVTNDVVRESAKRSAALLVQKNRFVDDMGHRGTVKPVDAHYDLNSGAGHALWLDTETTSPTMYPA